MVWTPSRPQPVRARGINGVDVSAALQARGRRRRYTGADLADDWQGGFPCSWPVLGRHQDRRATCRSRVDQARFAGDGVAAVVAETRARGEGRGRARRGRLRAAARGDRHRGGARGRRAARPRRARDNRRYTWPLVAGDVDKAFADAAVTVKERYRQQRLIPTAMEPRGVLCELNAAGDVTVTTSTQGPHIMRTAYTLSLGIPEAKVRVIAPDVGGGFGSKLDVYAEDVLVIALARKLGRPVKWIEERIGGHLATIHGRDVIQEIELAATAEGKITAVRVRLKAAMGAYLQARHPGRAAPRRLALRRLLRRRRLRLPLHGRVHEHDADRRLPRRRPARGDVRDRARHRRARAEARQGPGRDPQAQLHRRVPRRHRLRPPDRLRRLPRVARQGARDRSATTSVRAEQEERRDARGPEAARHRLLDLRRDVRPRAVADPRRAPLRRRRLGVAARPRAADRHGAGHVRHVAARAGPRDDRSARSSPTGSASTSTTWSSCHGDTAVVPTRDGHVRQPQPRPSAASRSTTRARRWSRRRAQIAAHQLEVGRGRPRVRGGPLLGQGQPGQGHAREGGRFRRLDGAQPPGRDGARPRGDVRVRPAELLLALGLPHRRRRGRHRDRRRPARPLRRRRRRRHRHQPDDRRRAGARRHRRRASRRRSGRRRSTTRTATSSRARCSTTSFRARPSCRRSSSTARRRRARRTRSG